jgi:hypothetical protein
MIIKNVAKIEMQSLDKTKIPAGTIDLPGLSVSNEQKINSTPDFDALPKTD